LAPAPSTFLTKDSCAATGFRGASAKSVICPGTPSCGCEAPAVCCLSAIDSQHGSCTTFSACRDLALTCDGPEDCNGGVCCLDQQAGGGTTCKAPGDCGGTEKWLCRTDADCAASPAGNHCRPADFGTSGVEDRGLDGLIGICQK
jgi:hypothetical protein